MDGALILEDRRLTLVSTRPGLEDRISYLGIDAIPTITELDTLTVEVETLNDR